LESKLFVNICFGLVCSWISSWISSLILISCVLWDWNKHMGRRDACCYYCVVFLCSQEQSGALVNLLRQFHALKSTLGVTVENALAVTHNLPDHNHSPEEVRRILVRVRDLLVGPV